MGIILHVNSSVVSTPANKNESYTINADGHYVGCDGFVVPKTFGEFYEREPLSVRRFLMKKLRSQTADEALLDMEQDLLLHLHYLPEKSKYRLQGKTDIVQCFDPAKQHGASAKRFHNYLALCMSNRLCTILGKQRKNPVYNQKNLSITSMSNDENKHRGPSSGEATDEFIYNNSAFMTTQSHHDGEANFQRIFINEFKAYVAEHAPGLLPVIDAIAETNSLKDARQVLAVDNRTFEKQRETLDLLQDCFRRGEAFAPSRNAAKNRRNTRLRAALEIKKAKRMRKESVSV